MLLLNCAMLIEGYNIGRLQTYLEFVGSGADVVVEDAVDIELLEVVELVRQTPGDMDPLRHLQEDEQELPGVPFRGPSSHSSSKVGS